MAIDLGSLSPKQLGDLIARAESRRKNLLTAKASKVRAKLTALAKSEGFTIEELFGTGADAPKRRGRPPKADAAPRAVKRVVKPKYRNPANAAETWSGRGKRPRWFHAALAAGKKEKDLLIAG